MTAPEPVESVLEPVPSVLPAEGIDLHAELARYKSWIIEQAMAFAAGHVPTAADLIGYTAEGLHYTLRSQGIAVQDGRRHRRAPVPGGRRRGHATASVAPEPEPTEPAPAAPQQPAAAPQEPPPPAPAPAPPAAAVSPEEAKLRQLAARMNWAAVERMRADGIAEYLIARRLAGSLGANKYAVEKVLKLGPPGKAAP